ncbi:MAG: Lrp/AsnC family transcriptional regulator [Chloroflexi bacterium]|nr:Lrp/AsnC family transcriptional regulator [Chloroflexota bacterium]
MRYKVDEIDRLIIGLLQEDGRMPSSEITRRIGNVSEKIVRYRLDKLIEEGVIRISAIVNPEPLGYAVIADVWLEVESGQVKQVVEDLTRLQEVSYIAYSMGEWDISMQVYGRNNQDLYQFVRDRIGEISGVKKASMVIVPMIVRDVYSWRIPILLDETSPDNILGGNGGK